MEHVPVADPGTVLRQILIHSYTERTTVYRGNKVISSEERTYTTEEPGAFVGGC